jgi:tetraacyldisaccharide 4'-kinase
MRPPDFWSSRRVLSTLLLPAACVYAEATRRRLRRPGWRAPVPVICVGNITVGGAGKTPTAIAIARLLRALGKAPHFLTRGYRGREAGPLRVDPAAHDFRAVGDEALLLARVAPTWVARDRAAGAKAAVAAGAGCIVMDDGFQNPALVKDLSLVVVDGGYGFGNRRVLPAGPLREPVDAGIARADAIVLIGEDIVDARRHFAAKPVLEARIVPDAAGMQFSGKKVVAFCGIGRPDKFFETLKALGADLVEAMPFPDHHAFSANDIMLACEIASERGAVPVTTEKDYVRLPPEARRMVEPVPIDIEWAEPAATEARLRALFTAKSGV